MELHINFASGLKIMGKTVTTYLIDGDPKGTQYVFISNKICQIYVIPRSNISILNEDKSSQSISLCQGVWRGL